LGSRDVIGHERKMEEGKENRGRERGREGKGKGKVKKALDYVSHYQLKSACNDAICIAPSKVTQMIFAVLED